MQDQLRFLQKKIIKNLIYFVICFLLGIFLSFSVNISLLAKVDTMFNNISDINSTLHGADNIKVPYFNKFQYSIANIQTQNDSLDENFENKVKNFLSYVHTMAGNYDEAIDNLNDDNRIYYFNQGNINLFKSYGVLYSTGNSFTGYKSAYETINQAISSYNTGALLLGTGDSYSPKIVNNRNIAYQLRFLIGAQACVSSYKGYIKQFDEIIKKLDDLDKLFDKAISDLNNLQKNLKDKSLADCLKQINKDLNTSKLSLQNMSTYIKSYKKKVSQDLNGLVLEPDQCMQRIEQDGQKITSANEQIKKGLDQFNGISSKLGDSFNTGDEKAVKQICQGGGTSGQDQEFNNNINDGLDKLDQTLGDKQQSQQNNNQQDQGQKQGKPQNDPNGQQNGDKNTQNQNSQSNTPQYNDIPKGYEKQLIDQLQKNAKNWINQMNNIRGDKQYNVDDYINQLFQGFYGNQKDFTDQQGGTGAQYDNGY